jgi:drug/metabolite transporter (DMT)-like permease
MKKALIGLDPIAVGALRILFTASFLVITGFRKLKLIQRKHWKYIVISAFVGTFFPAFFFAIAIAQIDSSIAAVLNSLVPLNTLILGVLLFGFDFKPKALLGVLIGLLGTLILILKGAALNPDQNYWYASLILLSAMGYAINVNIIKKYLSDLNAVSMTLGNFVVLIIPTVLVLIFTGFFDDFQLGPTQIDSFIYLAILAIIGTAFAKIVFNRLVQISTPVFASSVTYLIPIVALCWGVWDGEEVAWQQLSGAIFILLGVYLTNRFMRD